MKRLFSLFLMATLICVASIADNVREVLVSYSGSKATVEVSPDLNTLVTVSVNGADVQITQSADVTEKVTYHLSVASDNGSFQHSGDSPITLSFEGLKLTSQTGAAVQIKNGQRIAVVIKENTDNVLTDMEGGSQKACMVVKGALEFWGTGSLALNGRGKHALKCDGCVELAAANGKITMTSSVKDGIHTDESVLVSGGTAPELCLMLTTPTLQEGYSYQLIDENTATVLASVASLSNPCSDMPAEDSRFSKHTYFLGQLSLPYRQADICLEQSASPILVLYLHGGTMRGDDNASQLKEAAVSVIYDYLAARNIPATFIVPQCPAGGGWTSQLRRVVNELMKQYAADGIHDANRVYVMGGSMGGTGTWTQLSSFPDFYAAAMPVAGNPTGLDAANVATTPVRTVMGTADNIMSITPVVDFQASVIAAGAQ